MTEHSEIYKKVLYRTSLGDEIRKLNEELLQIKKRRLEVWPKLRADSTSDKQADMKWESSLDGIREMEIKYLADALKHKRSDIKLEITTLRDESFNQY